MTDSGTSDLVPVTVLGGDGVGPELVQRATELLDAAGADLSWEWLTAGEDAFDREGRAVPGDVITSLRRNGLGLKGPMTNPLAGTYPSPSTELRQSLGLYANVRWGRSHIIDSEGDVRIHLIRDVTEDFEAELDHPVGRDGGIAIRRTTRPAVERLARFVVEYCRGRKLTRIVVAHQATKLRHTDGLFLETMLETIQHAWDEREWGEDLSLFGRAVDATAAELIRGPETDTVVVSQNLYGGILGGVVAGVTGSVGCLAGANFGDDTVLFEAGHGTAPQYVGTGRANPLGLILSAVELVRHLGLEEVAGRIEHAIQRTIEEDRVVTRDLGGTASTDEFVAAVSRNLDS